jgi:hypothetical protein
MEAAVDLGNTVVGDAGTTVDLVERARL